MICFDCGIEINSRKASRRLSEGLEAEDQNKPFFLVSLTILKSLKQNLISCSEI